MTMRTFGAGNDDVNNVNNVNNDDVNDVNDINKVNNANNTEDTMNIYGRGGGVTLVLSSGVGDDFWSGREGTSTKSGLMWEAVAL